MIWEKILEILKNPGVQKRLLAKAEVLYQKNRNAPEIERLKGQIEKFAEQMAVLSERLAELPKSVPAAPIYAQMEKIEMQRKENTSQLVALEAVGEEFGDNVIHLKVYREFLNGLKAITERPLQRQDPTLCRKAIRKLVYRIEILEMGFRVHYLVGEQHFNHEIECDKHTNPVDLIREKNFLESGSNSLTFGVASGWVLEPQADLRIATRKSPMSLSST